MKQSKQFYHKVWAEKICTHIPLTMNLAEKLKLDYEIRLREAPSNKLWSQYARWEASQGRVRAACVICERYLDSTADPSEDMWLLYAELSPSRSMKLDIFTRAIQQQPLSTRLHRSMLQCFLSHDGAPLLSIADIEHLVKNWMNRVLEHGSPSHLEALFKTLVDSLEQLICYSSIQQCEELALLLLHAYASIPGARDPLRFVFNALQQLIEQSGFNRRKLFISALKIFTLIFPTLSSFSEQYLALHRLYLLYEFMQPRLHSLFFAETLVSSPVNNTSESPFKSIYALLFAARTNLETAPSLGVTELCLLLAYDSLLTLQVDDRIFQSGCCSIFNIVSPVQLFGESWFDRLSVIQLIIESELFVLRKTTITEVLKNLVLSMGSHSYQSNSLSDEQLVQLYSSIQHLLQRFPSEPEAFKSVEYLLSVCLPTILSRFDQLFGLVEGLLQMLLTSPRCARFTDRILSIIEEVDPMLFDPCTIRLVLRAMASRTLITENLSGTTLARIVSCSIINGEITMAIDVLLLARNKQPCFELFQNIIRIIFDNTEAKGMFSTTIRCLSEITSILLSDVEFRNDIINFSSNTTLDLNYISVKDFLDCSAIVLLLFLACMTQQLAENHIFDGAIFEDIIGSVLKQVEIVHIGVKMGDIILVDQYAKLSSLIGTVFEYYELITGAEAISGRVALECVVSVKDKDQSRSLLLYEVVPIDRSDGDGLLKLLDRVE